MAISIASLNHRSNPKPPITIIFGPGGVGKSTMAAGADAPVFLAVEDGIGTLNVPHWSITSFAEVIEAISALYSEEHDRRTCVIDSLDWLEPLVWAEACRENNWSSIEDAGYGKGYVAALTYWREIIEGLRALRDDKGITVVLLAHHTVKRFDDPANEPYDRYLLKMHDRASNLMFEFADVVGFMNYRVSITKADAGFNKKIARGVGGGQRVLYLEERPGFVAKNRCGMPASIDLPTSQDPAVLWGTFAQHIPTADTAVRDAA